MATIWVYEKDRGWYGHIDFGNQSLSKSEGPFVSEAQAHIVVARMNGFEPESDMLKQRERERE